MKITQIYISPHTRRFEAIVRSKYQMLSNYLSLPISVWVSRMKLDYGAFNRVVFEEGDTDDFAIVGNHALVICLNKDFHSLDQLCTSEQVHQYFVRKYMEGFTRFDQHFGLSLTIELGRFISESYVERYAYEKKLASRKVDSVSYAVIGVYTYDAFNLLVRKSIHIQGLIEERVIYTASPDPFVVHFRVGKIKFEASGIRILTKNDEETAFFSF